MDFHRFYFDLGSGGGPHTTTMASPHVRMLGPDAAVVSCVRLVQRLDPSGNPVVVSAEETRVWHRHRRGLAARPFPPLAKCVN